MNPIHSTSFIEIFLLTSLTFTGLANSEVLDVTTIYKYERSFVPPISEGLTTVDKIYNNKARVEIHAQNNALNLPFILHNGTAVDPNFGVDIESSNAFKDNKKWEKNNFVIKHGENFLNQNEDVNYSVYLSNNVTDAIFYPNKMELTVSLTVNYYGTFAIFLMEDKGSITSSNMYYIQIRHPNYGANYLMKCADNESTHGTNNYELPSGYGYRRCVQKAIIHNVINQNSYRCTVKISVSNGSIVLKNPVYGTSSFYWTDENPIDVNYVSFGTMNNQAKLELDPAPTSVFGLEKSEGSLTSPVFSPKTNKLCVSVNFAYPYTSEIRGDLHLSAIWSEWEVLNFTEGGQHIHKLTTNWNLSTRRFITEISEEKKRRPLRVKLQAHTSESLNILRIAGCNGEDMEDVFVLSESKNVDTLEDGYDVAVPRKPNNLQYKVSCKNGGKFDSDRGGCVCPAGFMGTVCETGCGPNLYGSKCDRYCSKTKSGCEGMKLCRPNMKCTCAAGLTGAFCDSTCFEGKYGANCEQECGNCKNNLPCDPYTGSCPHGCKPGFYLPYCKEKYKYLTVAPEEENIEFYSMKIKFALDTENIAGRGNPWFYQVQYREHDSSNHSWWEAATHEIKRSFTGLNIIGLKPATKYDVRIIIINDDGGSYQGADIPQAVLRTSCEVPKDLDYNLHLKEITEDSFKVTWNYTARSPIWCPVSYFEVEAKEYYWSAHYYRGTEMEALFTDLLAGQQFNVRVRAVTIDGPAPFSDFLVVNTKDKVPGKVFNLQLVSKTSDNLEISWLPPINTAGKIRAYKVTYKCQSLLACKKENCSYSSGVVEVAKNSTNLHGLLPFAQYSITVSAKAASWGPEVQLLAATDMSAPQVSPGNNSNSSISQRSNSSFTVHWNYPQNCINFNGYVYGYRYEFYESNKNVILKEKNITYDNKETFTGLQPSAEYFVKVFLVTSGGWSSRHPLVIRATTRATTPTAVKALTVYKRGRRMLGFRWAAPEAVYGDIESFTVTYQRAGYEAVSSVLEPTSCIAWPKLYCHTFNNLHPDTEYVIKVQTRNNEVAEDGEASTITTITKESAPQAPSFIRVESQTQTDIALEWGLPNMVNGVLRSFLVNVEETDSYNTSACCQYFPIQEVAVRFEQEKYRVEFTGLQPASTYTVSVTAKTIAMGPPITMTAHTRPPVPSLNGTFDLSELTSLSMTPTIDVNPVTEFQELISKYLVIVSTESSDIHMPSTKIKDEWLKQELSQLVNGTFYVAQELSQVEIKNNPEIELGSDNEHLTAKWADVVNPALEVGGYYRIGLAVILDYCGMLSVAYTETKPLQVLKDN